MVYIQTVAFLVVLAYVGKVYCCDDPWVQHRQMCYLFSHDIETWIGALQMCRELGGQLVEIETASENTFLKAQAKTRANDQFRMALNDVNKEGDWIWMNSKRTINETGFSDWFPGQPGNALENQNCGAFLVNHMPHVGTGWQWNDVACLGHHHYICEKQANGEPVVVG